ncbi:hypothetical protein [Ectopseudomonas mendocina]|uniref:Uncharacterized protein n=1 Tax=Ectopseudomonas mendocina TaxID=300 RepID=A0A2R3QVH3_ECTME|nr:hypothetical protein [Pseudomonas mendocina]AVO55757.1 hypothetical protein C7A17_24390 [Pseudomonas mendocina]
MKTFLIAVPIAALLVSYFIADADLTSFQLKYLSIFGTVGTLLGLCYTIVQVSLVKKESVIIAGAAEETKKQVLLLACVADWARGVKVAQEIQIHCRNGKREIAIPRLQELKQILYDIAHSSDSSLKSHGDDAGRQIVRLNLVINGFEKDPATGMSSHEIANVNEILEKTIDLLSQIQSITKNKG